MTNAPDPAAAELVGQYFLQVWDAEVWRQGRIIAVEDDGTMVAELIWWEPYRPSVLMDLTPDCRKQLALFDNLEDMQAAYDRYHPRERAALAEIRGAIH